MFSRPQRRLHLIDAENLGREPRPSAADAASLCRAYADLIGCDAPDHAIVACNHGAALAIGTAWPGARLLVRSGTDGADRRLLDVIAFEEVPSRYDSVVLGSGDGIFVDAVLALRLAGIEVTVVAVPGTLSKRLALAANEIVFFPTIPPLVPAAAFNDELAVGLKPVQPRVA